MNTCQCGCGQPTKVATHNDRSKGWTKGTPLKFLKGHNLPALVAENAAATVGNRSRSSHGYVVVNTGKNSRQYEHILTAQKAIGRPLRSFGRGHPKSEVVHHVNGNKADNRPANLLICTHEYHTALHHRLEASPLWPEFQPVTRNVGSRA